MINKAQSLDFGEEAPYEPLAARMRPTSLDDYIGQSHILAEGKPLYKAIQKGLVHSMIFWGPPGTGKTSLAELIALYTSSEVLKISAVTNGVKEIREAISIAEHNALVGKRTILFVDEVHRFNKSQQDVFLPYIESGVITFIGATTENPSFELNSALLSRARVYLLKSLSNDEIVQLLSNTISDSTKGLGQDNIQVDSDILHHIAELSNGDARKALNTLEVLADIAEEQKDGSKLLTTELLQAIGMNKVHRYDKKGDQYYDLISAFHKSIRGSNPDAGLYWYARIISSGGDPLQVARRLLAIASEDVGNADPRAMQVALAAWDCFTRVGPAEGERAIAQAIVYLACAPKSNAVYLAFSEAKRLANELPNYDVPLHLKNAPTALMKNIGNGENYRYSHNEQHAYSAGQTYLPDELIGTQIYAPTNRGFESKIAEKLNWLHELDKQWIDNSPK